MRRILFWLMASVLMLTAAGCGEKTDTPTDVPEDFSFFLRWNVYGVSYYDSETGELMKSEAEPEKEKYRTTLMLDEEQLRQAWEAVAQLDWEAYVTEDGTYDPNPGLASAPSLKLELIVTENGRIHRVLCPQVAIASDSPYKHGQALLTACDTLQDLLTETPEWQDLPDLTVLFD